MIRGIDSAAAGMLARVEAENVTANNLANSQTPGFKRDTTVFQAALSMAIGAGSVTQTSGIASTDYSQGALRETGDKCHFALQGDGFMVIDTPAGQRYTRNGAFLRSDKGFLVTSEGHRLLGAKGPIQIPDKSVWDVDETGAISVDGSPGDTIRMVRFTAGAPLARVGGSLWATSAAPTPATGATLRQGMLEDSNANPVREMTGMIANYRSYEACQRAITSQDETLDKLVNEVGRAG